MFDDENSSLCLPIQQIYRDPVDSVFTQCIFGLLFSLVLVCGFLANFLTLYYLFGTSYQFGLNVKFLISLTVSDLLISLTSLPWTAMQIFTRRWLLGTALCRYVPLFQKDDESPAAWAYYWVRFLQTILPSEAHLKINGKGASIFINSFTLMAIAVERYTLILNGGKRRSLPHMNDLLAILIWIFGLLAALPYAWYMKLTPICSTAINLTTTKTAAAAVNFSGARRSDDFDQRSAIFSNEIIAAAIAEVSKFSPAAVGGDGHEICLCGKFCEEEWPDETFKKAYGICAFLLQFVAPVTVLTFCYWRVKDQVSTGVRRRLQKERLSILGREKLLRRRQRTSNVTLLLLACFVAPWLPVNLLNILRDHRKLNEDWISLSFALGHLLAMTSILWNPVIYCWYNKRFFENMRGAFGCSEGSHSPGQSGGSLRSMCRRRTLKSRNPCRESCRKCTSLRSGAIKKENEDRMSDRNSHLAPLRENSALPALNRKHAMLIKRTSNVIHRITTVGPNNQ
uniref:G-protein coupled receptors family 1 profile domain-containing protein n=1 Tax=Romanomermis culicivorax TaxID=13658 RepID=A0A915IYS9_ROMCU